MPHRRLVVTFALGAVVLAGGATWPVNVIAEVVRQGGCPFPTRQAHDEDKVMLVILAVSGGTRARRQAGSSSSRRSSSGCYARWASRDCRRRCRH